MKGLRIGMLVLAVWLGLAGVSFAKQVFFRDGSVLECESFWKRNGVIVVKVNRDVLLEFAPGEINLKKSMERAKRKAPRAALHNKPAVAKAPAAVPSAAPAPAVQIVKQAQGTAPAPAAAVARTAATPAPPGPPARVVAPAPAAPPAPAPEAAAPTAAPLTREGVERRSKENVEMMAQAIKKGDPELMKKAVEAQKSLAQQQKKGGGGAAAPAKGPGHEPPWFKYFLMLVVSGLIVMVALWVVFRKAGQSGVKSIIPIYNCYVLMQISGKPGWWCLLLFIPVVGVAIYLLAMLALAEKFQRSPVFGVGLVFLPMIFFPLLAFGGSRYGEVREEVLDFTFSEEPPQV
ncbi:DUF5684 domain-containing protein [Geomonas propionica]|uniref:DUF805 domain-containing protein n=1 Tax=Geomonas propionica TaxID=2798582 RepID=A0ABS0YUK3_9BACT|nr:DUF5684 domain-containing protein [Geomonas propionica]MBJ6801127.1 DUF805 domain-containing protein [Geomonas propionica]